MSLSRAGLAVSVGLVLASAPLATASAKETRNWVVSWFTVASYSEAKDCPNGLNPPSVDVWANGMRALGLPESEVKGFFEGTMSSDDRLRVQQDFIRNRARIDGKPVNVYANPLAREFLKEPPHFNTTTSKWGFGFDLDGNGASSPNGFEDPETHQRGVDNEYYRVMSCMITYQAKPPARPSNRSRSRSRWR